MNRIETKIVMMITNRLAEARECDAKEEMIEELSENLYQRYLELTQNGMSEQEALDGAMESLGDVEELLAYLEEEGEEEESGRLGKSWEKQASHGERGTSFTRGDLESGIEEIVNAALSTAKIAVDCAKDVAKEVSEQLKEKYPEGVFSEFAARGGRKVDCTAIPSECMDSLEIRLTNGSVTFVCADNKDGFVEVQGDTDEIVTMLRDDGVLSISQGNTASAAYFFMRGIRRSDLVVGLPERAWRYISVSTVDGDIRMKNGMRCEDLKLVTVSGNLELEHISCNSIELRSASGRIAGCGLEGMLRAETKSGSIDIEGDCGRCDLFSVSGNICFNGESRDMNCSSTSRNVRLHLKNLPDRIKGSSVSGDCEVWVPAEAGFRVIYKTVSGKFVSDLPLTETTGQKSGEALYGDGGRSVIRLSNVSGDVGVYGIPKVEKEG